MGWLEDAQKWTLQSNPIADFNRSISTAFNPFDPTNGINQGVTQFGHALFGGLDPANNPYNPAFQQTPDQANAFVSQLQGILGPGVDYTPYTTQVLGPNARMTPEAALALANQQALQTQTRTQQEQLNQQAAGDRAAYESSLNQFLGDQGLGGVRNRATSNLNRYSALTADPNALKSDAEYGGILAQVNNQTRLGEQQAREQGNQLTANRGAGLSGAARAGINQSAFNGQQMRQNELSRAWQDAFNRKGTAQGVLDALPGTEFEARQDTLGNIEGARNRLAGLNANLTQQQYGMSPDWSGALGDAVGYRVGQQGYGQGQAQTLFGNALSGIGIGANVLGTSTNQIKSFLPGKFGGG